MATGAVCGYTGSTSLGTEVTAWEVNLLEDTPDATSMDSNGFKEFIACLQSAEGTFDSQVPTCVVGGVAGVTFTNDIEEIEMDVIVTAITVTTPVEGKVTYRHTFVSTGPVSVA